MGSPRVFQTAPPQPASKARMTCSPQLVGGAEASQKGLGEWIFPAKRTERSGSLREVLSIMGGLQELCDAEGGAFAVGDGVHDFSAAIDAIAAGEVPEIGGLAGGAVDLDAAIFDADAAGRLQKIEKRRLADSGNDHVAGNGEGGVFHGHDRTLGRELGADTFEGSDARMIVSGVNDGGLREPVEADAFLEGLLELKGK